MINSRYIQQAGIMCREMLFFFPFMALLAACTKEDIRKEQTPVSVRMAITRAVDPNAAPNEDQIKSLAVFVFASGGEYAEWSSLETGITTLTPDDPGLGHLWNKKISVFAGNKKIYVLANYDQYTYNAGITITKSIKRTQLESLIASAATFNAGGLMMSGYSVLSITPASTSISVEMKRCIARVDVHPYVKGTLTGKTVTLQKITLINAVGNAKPFPEIVMSAAPDRRNTEKAVTDALSATVLTYPAISETTLKARFYSFPNLVPSLPTEVQLASAPKLRIDISVNGALRRYESYITDVAQVNDKYALLPGNIYRIIAALDESEMKLSYTVTPWVDGTIPEITFN